MLFKKEAQDTIFSKFLIEIILPKTNPYFDMLVSVTLNTPVDLSIVQ